MSFRLNDDIVGRMLKDCSYKGSEHKEIFKKDVATFFSLVTSGIKDMRAIGATEEYCIDVVLQDRQFPFVLADHQMPNPLRDVCRSGEVPNLFKEDGSVRVARIAMLPPGQLTDNFLRCLAEESLILDGPYCVGCTG
jgi:hypothetical protein